MAFSINDINEMQSKIEGLEKQVKELEDKLQLRMASDKESDEFWDDIFSAEDYPFNKENVYKELRDYYFVLNQIPKIYMEITGGTLSKTTYFASSVIEAYNDSLDKYYDRIDNLEYNNNIYEQALQNVKEVLTQAMNVKSNAYNHFSKVEQAIETITKAESEVLDADVQS